MLQPQLTVKANLNQTTPNTSTVNLLGFLLSGILLQSKATHVAFCWMCVVHYGGGGATHGEKFPPISV